jgi:hypothetical protein
MTHIQSDTETRILDAAKKVFIQKGLEGARMQEIADEAKQKKGSFLLFFNLPCQDLFPKSKKYLMRNWHFLQK